MKVLYYLILLPLSKLPSSLRYGLSDLLAFVLYRIVGYRRKMIMKNLAISYPDQSTEWYKKTTKAFYTNLSDIILESIHSFSISDKAAEKRIHCVNQELMDGLFEKGKSVILTGGHNVNWEVITLYGHRMKHDVYALYKPLKNVFMDEKVKRSRERFGTNMISIKGFRPYFVDLVKEPKMFIFGIDQSPRKGKGIWMDFLNRESLVFTGPERLAKEYDMAVVMGRMKRIKRGEYQLEYKLLTETPRDTPEGEITIQTNRDIEAQINEKPSDWLWSHNRWKHKREDGE